MNVSLALPSPVDQLRFEGKLFYLKRDDLIHSDFSGNKARKFHYYLTTDFPQVSKLVSYGSSQSNAMYSLSVLSRMKGWEFEYFVNHISGYLAAHPQGNYRRAIENGMKIRVQGSGFRVQNEERERVIFVEEGGRQKEAEMGVQMLAEEIVAWQKEEGIESLHVFLPSGTGTTALFLQKNCSLLTAHCSLKTTVFTTPCVGDAAYLEKQFFQLEKNRALHPTILDTARKYHFGKLYRDSYKIWLKLYRETGVEFDLLYDPVGWLALREREDIWSKPLLYIHQGGLIGNESMITRYERKYKDLKRENIL